MTEHRTLTEAELSALTTADRAALRAAVDGVPRRELTALLATDTGGKALRAAFERMPEFHTGRAVDAPVVVRWRVRREPAETIEYDLSLAGSSCAVRPAREDTQPTVTLSMDAVSFLEMASGLRSGMSLLMRGRLRIKGDVGLATRLESLFGLDDASAR
ncbi:hypothetical protein GCM10011581_03080 [Saccharopolyspora subtropica]|uniref:SCP2 domain-containing protein n=1 Tax=Saccharopolyspora thermophila TaxID=89367 RepID=A0A917JKQ1_9PSEU|nr:SCP2 sterol-binding domain-containing protein [Saccharopolyspora subtropica]GGI69481.1 hypothetical protein GCM10011581_03080 [Saccharopolyspora subtropica]